MNLHRSMMLFALWAAVGMTACAGKLGSRPTAYLAITSPDSEALVYVDEALAGRVGDFVRQPLRIAPGKHRIELRADGKLSFYREVSLLPGENFSLSAKLRPDIDQRDAQTASP